jgi:uncharacterized protein
MKIIISEIPLEGLELDFESSVESDAILTPVRARLRIEKHETEVFVKGDLTAEAKLQCGRCLKDFQKSLSIPVEAVYHPVDELKGEDTHEIKSEELDMDFYSGDELDLEVLLKEQIELNLPMKPLCSESCKGLCPECGTDLNTGRCSCNLEKTDPRFAALKKLIN